MDTSSVPEHGWGPRLCSRSARWVYGPTASVVGSAARSCTPCWVLRDALDEPLVALVGHADYYPRFGFRPAQEYGITPPVASWAPNFQVRLLTSYSPAIAGEFRYAQPFDAL